MAEDPDPSGSPKAKPGRLSLGRLAAFSLPAAPAAALETPLAVYLPAFYSGAGLSLDLVGSLFLVARLAEVPIALMAGVLCDRWGPRRGRRRFWLTLSAPLAMLGIWRLFSPPAGFGGGFLIGWLLVVVAASALLAINHVAWGAEITGDYFERTRIQGARQVASVAGLVLVLVPPILIEQAGFPDIERIRMMAIGGFLLLLLPLTVGLAVLLAPERPLPGAAAPVSATPRPSLRALLAGLAGQRALRRLLLVVLCDAGAIGVVTSLFVFLSRDVWGLGRLSSLLLLAYVSSGVICLGPLLRWAKGRSKSRTAAWIALGLAASLPMLLIAPLGGVAGVFACILLLGAPSASNSALLDSMMGDVAGFDANAHGRARTGLFFSLHQIAARVGRGAAIAGAYGVLNHIGFHPDAANAAAALGGFKLLYVGAPVLLQLCIAALMWSFPEPGRD